MHKLFILKKKKKKKQWKRVFIEKESYEQMHHLSANLTLSIFSKDCDYSIQIHLYYSLNIFLLLGIIKAGNLIFR